MRTYARYRAQAEHGLRRTASPVRDVSIVGIGQTQVGEHWEISLRDLGAEAVRPRSPRRRSNARRRCTWATCSRGSSRARRTWAR